MSLVSVPCPRCADPDLALLAGQGHCECAHCGARFAVDWSNGAPQLTPFADVLRESTSEAAYFAADRRLALIGHDVRLAQDVVDLRRIELRETTSRLKSLGVTYQAKAGHLGAWFRVALIVAIVAWLLVILVLERLWWYVGLAVAGGATVAAWLLYRARKRIRQQVAFRIKIEHPEIAEAKQLLSEALAHQSDLLLEQKLCAMIVRRYRNTDDDDDPVDARPTGGRPA